jgi:hypothetical protein
MVPGNRNEEWDEIGATNLKKKKNCLLFHERGVVEIDREDVLGLSNTSVQLHPVTVTWRETHEHTIERRGKEKETRRQRECVLLKICTVCAFSARSAAS